MKIKIIFLLAFTAMCSSAQTAREEGEIEASIVDARDQLIKIQQELKSCRTNKRPSTLLSRSEANDQHRRKSDLLEPLLPFVEAVDKAKRGYAQGYYALAIHYAKGVEIERDAETARQFLQKADAANYGNAVFLLAMLHEIELFGDLSYRSSLRRNPDAVGIAKYLGVNGLINRDAVGIAKHFGVSEGPLKGMLSFTNSTDVAIVRTGYERAISLGVSVATNELVRFERRLVNEQAEAKAVADNEARVVAIKAKNSEIAKSTLGILPVSVKAKESSSGLSRKMPHRKIILEPERSLLEPMLPLDDAIKLAEKNQGKGYYQLAVRYAQGNELPENRNVAYKLLCKACDVNYANAVLVEGLCDEADLLECISDSKVQRTAEISALMHRYCGAVFYSGRSDCGMLTNEVAFAKIMRKYAKAKELGLLEATNHMARLNSRLANFTKEEAERTAREKEKADNNRRVLSLLGDMVEKCEERAGKSCQMERRSLVDTTSHVFMDNLHPAHMAVGSIVNFTEGTVLDNSPSTTRGLWSIYSNGMSGNGFKLLVITRITAPEAYVRNLHYAVATISAAGNIVSIGPEIGTVDAYVGTE